MTNAERQKRHRQKVKQEREQLKTISEKVKQAKFYAGRIAMNFENGNAETGRDFAERTIQILDEILASS